MSQYDTWCGLYHGDSCELPLMKPFGVSCFYGRWRRFAPPVSCASWALLSTLPAELLPCGSGSGSGHVANTSLLFWSFVLPAFHNTLVSFSSSPSSLIAVRLGSQTGGKLLKMVKMNRDSKQVLTSVSGGVDVEKHHKDSPHLWGVRREAGWHCRTLGPGDIRCGLGAACRLCPCERSENVWQARAHGVPSVVYRCLGLSLGWNFTWGPEGWASQRALSKPFQCCSAGSHRATGWGAEVGSRGLGQPSMVSVSAQPAWCDRKARLCTQGSRDSDQGLGMAELGHSSLHCSLPPSSEEELVWARTKLRTVALILKIF